MRAHYGATSTPGRLDALRTSAGSWTGRRGTGAAYVDEMRADVDDRLHQAGLE